MNEFSQSPSLILLPAVDVADGKAVRLTQGEAGTETSYGDPVEAAEEWMRQGAQWLHLVDLDAAFDRGDNRAVIRRVVKAVGKKVNVELSGGIRDDESLEDALSTGAVRVNLGTAALENPELNERIKDITTSTYRWMRDTIEASRHKLPAEERGFDARFMTVIMFNLMFVYYDLVDEDKISADDYRAMLVNQIRNSAQRTVSS
jgi:tRNA-dihydrouridine synthase